MKQKKIWEIFFLGKRIWVGWVAEKLEIYRLSRFIPFLPTYYGVLATYISFFITTLPL